MQTMQSGYAFRLYIQAMHAGYSFRLFIQAIHSGCAVRLFIQAMHSGVSVRLPPKNCDAIGNYFFVGAFLTEFSGNSVGAATPVGSGVSDGISRKFRQSCHPQGGKRHISDMAEFPANSAREAPKKK